MELLSFALLVFYAVSSDACCSEASIIIKNYDGPIYLSAQKPCEEKILHLTPKIGCDFDCNCASKPASACVPINTACQYGTGYVPLYQDTCVNTQCTGLYNVPYSLYQDNQYYPVTSQSVYCVPQEEYTCGKCGRKFMC